MQFDDFISLLRSADSRWVPDDEMIPLILANFKIDELNRIYPQLSFDHHMQIVCNIWEYNLLDHYAHIHCPVFMIPERPIEPLSPREMNFLEAKEQGINLALNKIPELKVLWFDNSIHDIPLQRSIYLAVATISYSKQISNTRYPY